MTARGWYDELTARGITLERGRGSFDGETHRAVMRVYAELGYDRVGGIGSGGKQAL